MKEIRDKIAALISSYQKQLDLYEQIRDVGAQERDLIAHGHLDQLLLVLQEKEALLKEAGAEETQIRSTQDFLTRHFELVSFSIPQLKQLASHRYHQDIASLEAVVARLVPVLELLEEQERDNEALLNEYLEQVKGYSADHLQAKRAQRAYKPSKQ
jgi:GTP1/Obg family GTP-binding protein